MLRVLLKYQYKIQGTMHQSNQFKRQPKQPQFVKGMTLNQYLASYPTIVPSDRQPQIQEQQQNLEETTIYGYRKRIQSKGGQYKIEEIDQESIQDSVQYSKPAKTRATPCFDQGSNHLIKQKVWEDQLAQSIRRTKLNRISINSRENLKNYSEQKKCLRGKKMMSLSPSKRKNQEWASKGSITLYGNKFRKPSKRETQKMSDILTFYGKLSIEKQDEKTNLKNNQKGSDIRQNFKKKNELQLKELLTFQSRIRFNYSCGANYREMVVVGVKDKLNIRKQRHFE